LKQKGEETAKNLFKRELGKKRKTTEKNSSITMLRSKKKKRRREEILGGAVAKKASWQKKLRNGGKLGHNKKILQCCCKGSTPREQKLGLDLPRHKSTPGTKKEGEAVAEKIRGTSTNQETTGREKKRQERSVFLLPLLGS